MDAALLRLLAFTVVAFMFVGLGAPMFAAERGWQGWKKNLARVLFGIANLIPWIILAKVLIQGKL